MATVKLNNPFDAFHGVLSPRGIINRKKTYRLPDGKVIGEGKQEAYMVKRPRDYKKNPPTGEELHNINAWTESANRAAQLIVLEKNRGIMPEEIIKDYQSRNIPIYYSWQEAETLLGSVRSRFNSQLPDVRGSRPDAIAPIDKTTRHPKRYIHFPSFLRAVLYHSIKSS